MEQSITEMTLTRIEPVLAVADVAATVKYWHEVLGFPGHWTWGQPINHGGVYWHDVALQFSLDPDRANVSKGNSVFITVKNLHDLYEFHKKKNVEIVNPLKNQPWGMAAYTVKDINDYYVTFAGSPVDNEKKSATFPTRIKITPRPLAAEEYRELAISVGWMDFLETEVIQRLLAAVIYSVVAEDSESGQVVGCALLLGDNASFYYVKDVMVHPEWQSMHIGTALMKHVSEWINDNGANKALVALITGERLKSFYQKFGFVEAFSMIKYIER